MRATFDNGRWRPLVEVKLTLGGTSQLVWMLVDSGADRTTISPDLAKALSGLEFDQVGDPGPEILGMGDSKAGSGTPSREVDAEVAYLGRKVPTRLWVAPTPYPVLGREDFMKRFNCRFYWDRDPPEFFVEPAQPSSRRPVSQSTPDPTIRPRRKR